MFVRLGLHMREIRSWDRAIETASIVNAHMKEQYWVTPPSTPPPQKKRKKILPFEEASNNGLLFIVEIFKHMFSTFILQLRFLYILTSRFRKNTRGGYTDLKTKPCFQDTMILAILRVINFYRSQMQGILNTVNIS